MMWNTKDKYPDLPKQPNNLSVNRDKESITATVVWGAHLNWLIRPQSWFGLRWGPRERHIGDGMRASFDSAMKDAPKQGGCGRLRQAAGARDLIRCPELTPTRFDSDAIYPSLPSAHRLLGARAAVATHLLYIQ